MSGKHYHHHDSGADDHEHGEHHHHKRLERRFELPLVQGKVEEPDLSFLLRKSIERIREQRLQKASNPGKHDEVQNDG